MLFLLIGLNLPAHGSEVIRDSILMLVKAEEFKAQQVKQMKELPIEAIPILTEMLKAIPAGNKNSRQFYMLASKVSQFENEIVGSVLDDAVIALLSSVKISEPLQNNQTTDLLIKLKTLSLIKDLRVVECVQQTRAAIKIQQQMIDTSNHEFPNVNQDSPLIQTQKTIKKNHKNIADSEKNLKSEDSKSLPLLYITKILWVVFFVISAILFWHVKKNGSN